MNTVLRKTIKGLIPQSLIRRELKRGGRHAVALTFDDGPHPNLTPKVLDLLDEHEVRACFFVVGKSVEKHPEVLQEVKRRGHVIGNHSYDHPAGGYPTMRDYRADIERCQRKIVELTGEPARHFRPPLGHITFTGLMAARQCGLETVLWAREGGEWGAYKADDAATIANRLGNAVTGGDIVLLHDNNPKMAEILSILLPTLKQREFDLSNSVAWI